MITQIFLLFPGVQESEMNEYVVIGLGLGIISIVMIAVFLLCHRKRKRRRPEHPSNSLEHSSEFSIIWLRLIIRILLWSWNKKDFTSSIMVEIFIFYFMFSATKPCSFSYLRIDWRALCNKLLDKFSKSSKHEYIRLILNIL